MSKSKMGAKKSIRASTYQKLVNWLLNDLKSNKYNLASWLIEEIENERRKIMDAGITVNCR